MGPCLSPHVAGRPLRPATDHCPGRPLPHQLANRPQAPPQAVRRPFHTHPTSKRAHAELPSVSEGYPPPQDRLPTCSSPVRHVSARKHPVRLACIRHAASVDPEPGSNSPPMRHLLQTDGCPASRCCHRLAFQGFRHMVHPSVSDFHLVSWLPAHEIRRGPACPQVSPVRPIVFSMFWCANTIFQRLTVAGQATAPSSAPRSSPVRPAAPSTQDRPCCHCHPTHTSRPASPAPVLTCQGAPNAARA